jgi:hypothetical protein
MEVGTTVVQTRANPTWRSHHHRLMCQPPAAHGRDLWCIQGWWWFSFKGVHSGGRQTHHPSSHLLPSSIPFHSHPCASEPDKRLYVSYHDSIHVRLEARPNTYPTNHLHHSSLAHRCKWGGGSAICLVTVESIPRWLEPCDRDNKYVLHTPPDYPWYQKPSRGR